MFGLSDFITFNERYIGARSVNISHIVYLEKSDFIFVIKEFPKDFVNFLYFNIYGNYFFLN